MSDTNISWTTKTWNPVVGCTKVSQGCKHCYAKTLHDMRHKAHLAGKKVAPQYAHPFETVQLMPERLAQPMHWRAPRRIFVNSVSDLFHEDVPEGFIECVFGVMARAPQHQFQILTKRPARMQEFLTWGLREAFCHWAPVMDGVPGTNRMTKETWPGWPLPNVWLGVSCENQEAADERIPFLLQTPAAVRFISAEPLLGPIDLTAITAGPDDGSGWAYRHWNALNGENWCDCGDFIRPSNAGELNWIIVGGESGKGHRPVEIAWIESIVAQCRVAGVAPFVKQDSGPRSEQWGRIPEALRIREFPEVAA